MESAMRSVKIILAAAVMAVLFSTSALAERCIASVYFSHHTTANGGHVGHMTAAHKHHPFGSIMRVTNLLTGRHANFTINDRGPFVRGRCIDLSISGGRSIGISGIGLVSVERVH
jgi:rare lipoprotein A